MATTFSLKQGETRTSHGLIPHPLKWVGFQTQTWSKRSLDLYWFIGSRPHYNVDFPLRCSLTYIKVRNSWGRVQAYDRGCGQIKTFRCWVDMTVPHCWDQLPLYANSVTFLTEWLLLVLFFPMHLPGSVS